MDAQNNQVLYATTYQRRRTACCMNGGGPGSGLWKSTDGGDTWKRLQGGGWPEGPLGRIAVDVYRKRPNILYALVEGPTPAAGRGGRGGDAGERRRRSASAAAGRTVQPRDDADADHRHRSLSIGRRRRDVAEGERRKPAPDVLQPGAHRSERSRRRRSTAASVCISPATRGRPCTWTSPNRSTTTCTRSGSIRRTRTTYIIGNDGGLAVSWDQAKTWNFYPEHPGRPLLSRERGQRDAVQHLRRHAGQLQLVRAERGARRGRHRRLPLGDDAGRRRVRRAAGSVGLPHRLQRVAGRQHGAHRSRDRRNRVDAADRRTRRAADSMELGHAAGDVAAQLEHPLRRGQQGVSLVESRPHLGGDRRRPHRPTPTATTSSRWA